MDDADNTNDQVNQDFEVPRQSKVREKAFQHFPVAAARPRISDDPDGDGQAWLVTYTDLVTLLLVLFVALIALANFDPLPTDVQDARSLGGTTRGDEEISSGGELERPLGEGTETLRRLRLYVREAGLSGDVDVLIEDGAVRMFVRTPVTFEDLQPELNVQGREMILKLAPIFARLQGPITVMGGADDVAAEGFPSDVVWGLAAARAVTVADLMIAGGVEASRLTVAARPSVPMSQPMFGRDGAAGVVISIAQQEEP